MSPDVARENMEDKDVLSFNVPSLAVVDGKKIGSVDWPPHVKTLRFYPRKDADGLYALLTKNIPAEYNARLVYRAAKNDLRVPSAPVSCRSLKVKPFRSRTEIFRELKNTYQKDFLKIFCPGSEWDKMLSEAVLFYDKIRLDHALRICKVGGTAGFMMLTNSEYRGAPATLIGWIWIRKTLTISERRQVQHLMISWLKRKMRAVAVAGVDSFNPASQGFFSKFGFKVDRMNVTRPGTALISAPGTMPYLEWTKTYSTAWKAVTDADYKKAVSILEPVYRRYPLDFKVVKTYAMALGDYADCLDGPRQKMLKRRSCGILRGLVKRMGNVRWEWNISTRNEYYYHSGQFKKQYALGVESAAGGHSWGYYGQGVGAANYAYEHAAAGRRGLASRWAVRAINAWENFFKFKDDYYNAYVHYALALGIAGRVPDMEAALGKSGKLSGKPGSYREFVEVREKLAKL